MRSFLVLVWWLPSCACYSPSPQWSNVLLSWTRLPYGGFRTAVPDLLNLLGQVSCQLLLPRYARRISQTFVGLILRGVVGCPSSRSVLLGQVAACPHGRVLAVELGMWMVLFFSNIFWLICCGRVPQLRSGINVFPGTSLLTSFERLGADRWISDGINGSEKCIDGVIC